MDKPSNPGFAGGIAKRSPLQRLAWALKGADGLRKKDLRLSAMAAIAEGRKIRERVTDLMLKAEAAPEDARVYCVFVERDVFAEVPIGLDAAAIDALADARPPVPGRAHIRVLDEMHDFKLASQFADRLAIGFLIFVWDRKEWASNDPRKQVIWSIRPLIVEAARADGLNAYAMRLEKQRIEEHLTNAAGVFPDDQD